MLPVPLKKWLRQGLWPGSFVLLSSWLAYGYSYDRSNIFNQVPVIKALMNSSLLSQDFYIQEMTGFTPRSYYYHLVIFLHQLGLSIPVAKFGLFLLAFASMLCGLWSIGRYLGKTPFAGLALAFLGMSVTGGTVGVTDLFRIEPISAIYAMGITIWGIYFCCQRKWRLGYGMFGLATLLQFLIGFIPACLWGLGLLLGTIIKRTHRRPGQFLGAFVIFTLLVALVYVPMVLTGNTSSEAVSDAAFVELYGYIRHPHHIIMSFFPAKEWRDFVCLAGAGLVSLKLSDRLSFTHKRDLALTILTTCLLLVFGYVFVEVIPIALIAKLQFARATPFAMLTVWIALSVVSSEYHQRQNYPVSLLLLALPLEANIGPVVLLLLTSLLLLSKTQRKRSTLQPLLKPWAKLNSVKITRQKNINIAYALFFVMLLACGAYLPIFFASLAYPLLRPVFPKFFTQSRPYFKATTFSLALYLCLHLSGTVENRTLTPLHRKVQLYAQPQNTLAEIAVDFGKTSPLDALVLVPPSDQLFRYYSNRSVVVTFKSFPFTDQGILAWKERLEAVLGPLNRKMMNTDYAHERYRARSEKEIEAIAQKYGAGYVLTQRGWHPGLNGTVVSRVNEWEVWALNQKNLSNSQRPSDSDRSPTSLQTELTTP